MAGSFSCTFMSTAPERRGKNTGVVQETASFAVRFRLKCSDGCRTRLR